MSTPAPGTAQPSQPPRLLDLVRQVARARLGQEGPGERFADWTRRLVLFHHKRHPATSPPATWAAFWTTSPRPKRTRWTASKKPTPP